MRHLNFSGEEILETIDMVRTEQLDIRTITVGISLLDCVSDSCDGPVPQRLRQGRKGGARSAARQRGHLRGIRAPDHQQPHRGDAGIADRRPLRPAGIVADRRNARSRGARRQRRFHRRLLRSGREGHDARSTPICFAAIPEALAATQRVCASVNVGSTRAGLNMDAIAAMGRHRQANRRVDR